MLRMSPRPNSVVVSLLCVVVLAACADPRCPGGYTKMGDTCYRNKDGGNQSVSPVEGEDASNAEDDDETGSPGDAARDAGPSVDNTVDAGNGGGDSGREGGPPGPTDSLDGGTAMPAVDAATPIDGGGPSDSAAPDSGTVTCASQPCQNGGSCLDAPSGFRCSCAEPFMGDRCEWRTCTTMFLRTADDLAKARPCAEIEGDLSMTSAGIGSIAESDLPYLTKITGNFSMSGLANNDVETPRLRELTLAKLREIGGSLSVAQTGPGSASEIRLPALTQVGGSVVVSFTETRRLELPALRTVGGVFVLAGLKQLCTLEIEAMEQIGDGLTLADILNLPSSTLEPLRSAFSGTPTADNRIGCCLPIDQKCLGGFSQQDRDAYCGCSSP